MLKRILLTLLAAGGAACAQSYYVGILGGYGYAPSLTVTNSTGSADTGLKGGGVVGAMVGGDTAKHWGGEVSYLFRFSDLKLSSGGTEVDFGGHTQYVTGDILGYLTPKGAAVRPFVSFGGGVRFLVGTGTESASQPLGNYAALTATTQTEAVGDFGVGVKFKLGKSTQMRVEVRDYIGAAPNKVIAPAPGAKMSSMLNDLIFLASISYTW